VIRRHTVAEEVVDLVERGSCFIASWVANRTTWKGRLERSAGGD
jgi:hypothetical protein